MGKNAENLTHRSRHCIAQPTYSKSPKGNFGIFARSPRSVTNTYFSFRDRVHITYHMSCSLAGFHHYSLSVVCSNALPLLPSAAAAAGGKRSVDRRRPPPPPPRALFTPGGDRHSSSSSLDPPPSLPPFCAAAESP